MIDWTQFLGVGVAGVIVALSGFIIGVMKARGEASKLTAEAEKARAEADALLLKAQAEADKIRAEASQAEAEADATESVAITNTHNADLERFRKIIAETQKSYRDMGRAYENEIAKIRARLDALEEERREAVDREAQTRSELSAAKTQLEAARLDIIALKEEVCALKKLLGDKDLAIQERDARLQLVILENERLRREADGL